MPVPGFVPLPASFWTYYFVLIVGLLLYWAAMNLVSSRTGRALMAIRDNPIAARAMGINLPMYKATAFGISAMITGIAGALGAMVVKFVAPDSFTFTLSVALLVGPGRRRRRLAARLPDRRGGDHLPAELRRVDLEGPVRAPSTGFF